MDKNMYLEIAKLIGQPIDPSLPVAFELAEIADVLTAEVGEKVWRYTEFDPNHGDVIYDVSTGVINAVAKSATGDAEISFSGLNSKLEYVKVDDILGETDNTSVLARRKISITRSMDKKEVKNIMDAIVNLTAGSFPGDPLGVPALPEVVTATGNDLYDVILALKHKVEDYGDNFVLLCGSTVKEKLDTYDKDNVASFEYRIGIYETLKAIGVKVIKVFGQLNGANILDKKKMILVARNSRIAEGKPVKFVRRKINADIAKLMGADVDTAQRALIVNPTPVLTDGGDKMLAYGIYGYESIALTIVNPKAIAVCDASEIL